MRRKNIKKPIISALEQRILFDGAAVTTALDVLDNSSFNSNENTSNNNSTNSPINNDATQNNAENQAHEAQAVQGFERPRKEVAFVDVSVKDYQTLVDGAGVGVEVYLVESMNDIKNILDSNKDIDAIHILSHGKTGEITVGNDVLNLNSIDNYTALLESIKTSLTQDGDLLLYGCDVAANGNGQEFIDILATLTQADVAASNDVTGAAALGGDWDLEVSSGLIEAENIAINDFDGELGLSGANPLIYGTDKATVNEDGTVNLNGFTVSDSDTEYLKVSITAENGTLSLGITTGISGYSNATKTLVITGTSTQLTDALNSMTYSPDANYNGVENLVIKASDDDGSTWSDYFISRTGLFYNPTNQHYYEFVADAHKTWDDAKVLAEGRIYLGLGGYLATVTSEAENTLIASKLGGDGWFGASDAESEGIWKWVTGPEAGQQFWQDSTDAGTSGENFQGYAVNGMYNNWVSGEPNNSDGTRGGEDVAHYYATGTNAGKWNDFASTNTVSISGYIVEYGGLSTDSSSKPEAAKLAITVVSVNDAPTFTLPSNHTVNEDAGNQNISNFITNIGKGGGSYENSQTLTFTTTNNNSALFSSQPIIDADGKLTYKAADNKSGTATVTVTLKDNGGTANGGVDTITKTFTITVNPVNDIPILSAVTKTLTDTVGKDTFDNITGNLSTSDVDDTIFTYDFSNGTTSQVGTYGTLSISSSGVYTYVANADAINALSGNASDTFTIRTTDSGGTGTGAKLTGTASFTVNIIGANDAPINSVSSSQTVNEDTILVFNSTNSNLISISDVDSSNVTVTLAVSNGVLNLGNTSNITISSGSNASNTITFTGTKENVNAALNGLSYKGNQDFFGSDTLTVTTSDGNTSDTDTVAITINSVNDAPTISITESSVGFTETTDLAVQALTQTGSITVNDIDDTVVSLKSTSNNNMLWSGGTIDEALKTKLLAGFSLNSAAKTWTYDVKSVDLNFLAKNETITFSYTVTATDSQNATATDTITIKITGTNDAPVFGKSSLTTPGTNVLVFSKPNMNGSDASPGNATESANLASIVQYFINDADSGQTSYNENGTYTNSYTAYDFSSFHVDSSLTSFSDPKLEEKLNNTSFLFMPDMESGFNLSTDLPDSAKTILAKWVNDGGVMMMTGTAGSLDTNFLNTIFSWDLTTNSGSSWSLNAVNAKDTPFEGGPSFLSYRDATDSIGRGSVSNFKAIYGTDDNATVAVIDKGQGKVIFLGYDFYAAGIAGTGFTSTSTQFGSDVTTGETAGNDWVQQIVPRALQYSAVLSSSTALVETDGALTDSQTLTITDVDATDKVNITKSAVTSVQYGTDDKIMTSTTIINNEQLLNMLTITPHTPAIDGTETTKDLTWSFNSGTEHFDYLAKGEKVVITYTIAATDNAGETDTTDISVTIIGSNDTPVITVNASDSESKTISETNTTITTNGTLSVFDADISDTSTVSKVNVVSSGTTTGLASNNAALLNMLAVDSGNIIGNTTDSGKINWTFNSGNEYFNYLAVGETLTLSYTVRVTDSKGATSDKVITVNIEGTNDAPTVLIVDSIEFTEATDASSQNLTNSGAVSFNDIDASDVIDITFSSNNNITWSGGVIDSTLAQALVAGFNVSGTDVAAPGTVTWTYNASAVDLNFLATGEKITFSYTVTATDNNGAIATDTITITINGTDDKPTISSVEKVIVTEDIPFVFNGTNKISFADLDTNDKLTATISVGEGKGTLTVKDTTGATVVNNETGTIQISGTQEQINSAINEMIYKSTKDANGDAYTSLSISVTDGKTTTTSTTAIDVTPVDDNPVASSMAATVAPESQQTFAQFMPNFSDVDNKMNSASMSFKDAYKMEILSLPTIGVFQKYTGLDTAEERAKSSNWTNITNLGVDDRLIISLENGMSEMNNYRYNAGDNSGKSTTVNWRVMSTGNKDDSSGWSNTATGVVTIMNAADNTPPVVNIFDTDGTTSLNGGTVTILEDSSTNKIILKFSDTQTPDQYLQGIIKSSNDKLIDTSGISMTRIDANTIELIFTPKVNMYGTSTITLGAFDGLAESTQSFTLEVTSVNEQAIASDFTKEINEDTVFSFSTINPADIYTDSNDVNANKNVTDVNFDTQMGIIQNAGSSDVQINIAIEALVESNYFPRSFIIDTLPVNGGLYLGDTKIETLGYIVDITKLASLTYKPNQDYNINDGIDSFTWHAVDKDGMSTDTKTATFTVKAINDKPVISVNVNKSLVEDSTLSASGTINVTDVDKPNKVSVSNEGVLSSGVTNGLVDNDTLKAMLSVNSADVINETTTSGTIDWSFNPGSETFDYLANGEVLTLTYTIRATDTNDVTSSNDDQKTPTYDEKTITIIITGTNDTPVIEIVDVNAEIIEGSTLSDNGSIKFTDLDLTNTPIATEVTKSVTSTTTLTPAQQTAIENAFSIANTAGNTNNGEVTWNYDIAETDINYLAAGETVTAVFTITVNDANGGTATKDVTITMTGTNDTPVITVVDVSGAITEGNTLSDNGSIKFTDLDLTDRAIATEVTKSVISSTTLTAEQIQNIENAFSIANTAGNTNNGEVTWNYDIAETDINYLAAGETVTAVFTITVNDANGGTATKDVTITMTGTNDTPVITVVDVSGAITEGNTLSDNGSIKFTDLDLTDRAIATEVTKSVTSTTTLTPSQQTAIENAFSIANTAGNANNGEVTWNYTIAETDINYLAVGETVTAVFTITVNDANGGIASQDVTVTITGTNDAPTVSADNIDVELNFGETYSKDISGLFSDKDLTDTFKFEASNLPSGLIIDPNTGKITGKISQSGNFVIVLKATDSAGASITRTYNMQVIAPAQQSVDTPRIPSVNPEAPEGNVPDIILSDFNNDNSNSIIGVLNNSQNTDDVSDPSFGFLGTQDSSNNIEQVAQEAGDNTIIINNRSDGAKVKELIQVDMGLNVLTNGQVSFDQDIKDAFSVVGITIEDISFKDNYIEIKVIDTSFSQNFIVTQIDGSALPQGLFFDIKTGNITGIVPPELEELKISIKAINADGTTRAINLTLDLKQLKKANQVKENQAEVENRFIGLKEQIAMENKNLDGYGTYLTKLFA